MTLPSEFSFNQTVLQDYVDCKRRFQLRYLLQVPWPAVVVEPVLERERMLRLGGTFHRMIHQHKLGIPENLIRESTIDRELKIWWENYLQTPPPNLPSQQSTEVLISDRLTGHRLVAKYDLIAIQPKKKAVIVDWKTTSKRPKASWLETRIQSRLYPFLLVRSGQFLNLEEIIQPSQVEMIYWFANHPQEPAVLRYSDHQYQQDEAFLDNLITEIVELEGEAYTRTEINQRCIYCSYRSLCDRGRDAGLITDFEGEIELNEDITIDWDEDQVGETEFG
jgi:CRISPR/Cas system-associated exonuclease Cas4 (RecB family)